MEEKQKDSKEHYEITVKGRVQGIGFRYSAQNMARSYGITGIVRNTPSGDVYLKIEGSPFACGQMIKWCNNGPGTARVNEVLVYQGKVEGYESFRVVY